MPHYVNDSENPGQHIDVIELVRRHPLTPPPVNIEGLLKRDWWTRQEALLILAGLAPRNVVHGGTPIGIIGAGIVYLDGTTSAQLDERGLQHPRAQEWLQEFMTLAGYAAGQDMNERKAPSEWLEWANSKGFRPYWLAATIAGPADEWAKASPARKHELAAEAMKLHGTQQGAAKSLEITRQRLATVLRNSGATVASAFPESPWDPHKR